MTEPHLEELYREVILDHYKHPRGTGLAEAYDAEVSHVNPSCGDEITMRVSLDEAGAIGVSYAAVGCSISQASASVMFELVDGTAVAESQQRFDAFHAMVTSRGAAEVDEKLEDLLEDGVAFAGVAKFPMRVKCALLPWMALQDGLVQAGALAQPGNDIPGPTKEET